MGGAASYFENMTPAQKMYQWTFAVSIPQMHMYSQRELEIYGTVSSGDAEYDRALALEPIDAGYPIGTSTGHGRLRKSCL